MMAKRIKALIMTEQGGPEVLRIAEVDKPEIKKDTDVLVKVIVAGVNPADWQNRNNGAPSCAEDGKLAITILGIDGIGIVESAGSAVGNVKSGDGVWYNDGGYSHFWGSYAIQGRRQRFIEFKAKKTSAALPTVGLTSWLSTESLRLMALERLIEPWKLMPRERRTEISDGRRSCAH